MIKISGKRGEGAGLLTNLAIEKLLETHSDSLCFLIDNTSEFVSLSEKLKGIDIYVSPAYFSGYDDYKKYVISKLSKGTFFRFVIEYGQEYEYQVRDIEKLAEEIRIKYNIRIFEIYKLITDPKY